MSNCKLEKVELDRLYLLEESNLEGAEESGLLAEYFLNNPRKTIYVTKSCSGRHGLKGIITRGDYLRYCNGKKKYYVNKAGYRFTEEETDAVCRLFDEKKKVQAVPIVDYDGNLLYEMRKKVSEAENNIISLLGSGIKNIEFLNDFARNEYNPETLYIVEDEYTLLKKNLMKYYNKGLMNVMHKNVWSSLQKFGDVDIEPYEARLKYVCGLLTDCFDNIVLIDNQRGMAEEVENKIKEINHTTNVIKMPVTDFCKNGDGIWYCDGLPVGDTVFIGFDNVLINTVISYGKKSGAVLIWRNIVNIVPDAVLYASEYDCLYQIMPILKEKNVPVIVVNGNISYNRKKTKVNEEQLQSIREEKSTVWGVRNTAGWWKEQDISNEHVTIINGERKVNGHRELSKKSIYLFGPCTIAGTYVSDDETVAHFLQEKMNRLSYAYNVRNKGGRNQFMNYKMRETIFHSGDIVMLLTMFPEIYQKENYPVYSIQEAWDSLGEEVYHHIYDAPLHCDEKVMEKIAEQYMKILVENNYLSVNEPENTESFMLKKRKITTYLSDEEETIFHNWVMANKRSLPSGAKIGSIVMNCNPFTLGHRYLVEYASARVDYLYIFVVEEDRSVFSFEDRFRLVCEGCQDLKNVIVVPSGEFIISGKTLSGYFMKDNIEVTDVHTSYDTVLFAEYVAPAFDISVRFVGEEPLDAFTNNYNQMMKKNFSFYGVELVEIPRIEESGKVISASRVRKYLETKNMEEIRKLVPDTTYNYLVSEYLCNIF